MNKSNNISKNVYIAGSKTTSDWVEFREELKCITNEKKQIATFWNRAFDEFLMKRLDTRYIGPIQKIIGDPANVDSPSGLGEGFTIITIQCALIEFLASLRIGKNYIHKTNDSDIGKFEYTSSASLFIDFLSSKEPFKNCITSRTKGSKIYSNIRCALMHEARTTNLWRIHKSTSKSDQSDSEFFADFDKKIIYRDNLQRCIVTYLEKYKSELPKEVELQNAFIRKFNHLCDL